MAISALCLTACSVGSGSGSQGDPTGSSAYKGVKRTIIVPTVGTLTEFNSESGKQALLEAMQERTNITAGTCSNSSSSICSSSTAAGTLLGAYNQSYSAYAVIRNDYEKDEEGKKSNEEEPSNVYIALVTNPTTELSSVVDATYTGLVSYSRQNAPNIITRDTLTMRVKDHQVSGEATQTTNSGVVHNTITFESANIVQGSDGIVFSGNAVFRQNSFYSSNDYEGDIQGKYQGIFAGSQAEEMIGTFHSNNTNKLTSVQGAFAATK